MNQVLLGLAVPYAFAVIFYIAKGFRASVRMLIVAPMLMTIFSLWAIAPDIPRLLRMNGLYDKLYRNPKCDLFFWHYSIDKTETDSHLYTVLFMLIVFSLLFTAWRELKIKEQD